MAGMLGWEGSLLRTWRPAAVGVEEDLLEEVEVAEPPVAAASVWARHLRERPECCSHPEVEQQVLDMREPAAGQMREFAGHCLHFARLAARPSWTESPRRTIAVEDSQQECEEVG